MTKKTNDGHMIRDMGGVIHRSDEDTGGAEGERIVELSFSSEEPYGRWFGTEILSHDAGAVDLSRLTDIGVLLFNHDANRPVGRVLSAELDAENRRCIARVAFDTDEESERIYQKVRAGSLKGVSVGYRVGVWEEVEQGETSTNGRFEGPCSLATKWTPYEISIVSVPADATVGVGRSESPQQRGEEGEYKVDNEQKNMEQEECTAEQSVITPAVQESRDDGVRAVEAERKRTSEIMSMCRRFDIAPDEYVSGGHSVDEARAAILAKLAETHKPAEVTVAVDEADKFRSAATDGFAMRAGVSIDKPAPGAETFRGKSMLRLAAECIEREGVSGTHGMSDDAIVRAAMTGTGAFPGILSNVAHKSMAQAYMAAPTTFQEWTARGSNTDFKAATRYRLSEADELEEITESGEFPHAEVTEGAATAAIATYGRSFTLTRKAIINDDMGALSRIPALYGLAARRVINKLVYEILTKNPKIEGQTLFHADHGNLATGAISVAALGAAKAMMARQKNLKGKEALNVQPAFLIVPPELEVVAAQLINSVVDPTKANATPNPFANKLTVVSDPELTNKEEWYLAAAPGILPTVEVTYLNGNEAPTMESHISFKNLGIEWRIYLDFGVNLLDFRGILKSSGK